MYDELKKIEADIEEYCEGQICYYYHCELLTAPLDDVANLKEVLIRNKVIGKDDNVESIKIDDVAADFEPISDEWRFSEDIKQRFLEVIKNADGYYKVYEDDWSTCRIIQKEDEAVLLDFYICD